MNLSELKELKTNEYLAEKKYDKHVFVLNYFLNLRKANMTMMMLTLQQDL